MNNQKLEEKVKSVAVYLGCSEGELWSEMSKLFEEEKQNLKETLKPFLFDRPIDTLLSQSHQQGRMEMAEEILKTKFELNVDGNLFEVINPDIVSKMVTPPTINK